MRTPTPASYSESARRALLRRTWQPPFDSFAVDYSRPALHVELVAGDAAVFSGGWDFETTVAGESLAADGGWEEVCWHSDQEVDYLEIEITLSGGWTLQRQMALARKDQFLFLADALLGPDQNAGAAKQEIRHCFRLPVADGVSWQPAEETREGNLIHQRKRLARVLPLSLPEWRVEHSAGDLRCDESRLVMEHAGLGRRLYSPLWIDLAPARHRQECTWRRLTVGENLEIQPRDVAAGFRVQCGNNSAKTAAKSGGQWLIYRSLAPRASRTVLGQNYATDFVLSRFFAGGKSDDIVEIE